MRVGLILGTGMAASAGVDCSIKYTTQFGPVQFSIKTVAQVEVCLLSRHGPAMNIPPHLINYRANMVALKDLGVERVIATSAVGSLKREIVPGSLGILKDFIDFTKRREFTIFDEPIRTLPHTDFSVPYCPVLSSAIARAAAEIGMRLQSSFTYVCVDGPRYESPAEVRMFAQWGGDVVGMTGVPEVVMARELGMCYASLALVTNFGAGLTSERLEHDRVADTVTQSAPAMWKVLERAIATLEDSDNCSCRK